MSMWRVTVAPIENVRAWQTFVTQGVIAIGWCDRQYDCEEPVLRFRQIRVGDWVVAHVPESHGGEPCMALGVGKVVGDYEEILRRSLPPEDQWTGSFRRQYKVEWTLGSRSLRGALAYYRGTVRLLTAVEQHEVFRLYGMQSRTPASGGK